MRSLATGSSLTQSLNPAHSTLGSMLVALIPIVLLLILLPVMRMSAWRAVIIGAAVTIILPPWVLILLVTGRRGLRGAWPLAVVGSLSFIAGQLPASQFLGPYLPGIRADSRAPG